MDGHRLSDPHSHLIMCFALDTLEHLKRKEAEAVSGRESYENVYNPHLSFAYFFTILFSALVFPFFDPFKDC